MTFICSELGDGTTGCFRECCFGVMYVEYYGVVVVVFSMVEVFLDYGAVYVFHVLIYVVESCLFRESECCLLCCYVV